ncbi:MAG: hypothetical protein LBV80_09175 [Deltaproteobacteria bacterium]|nr:hypothetical protein [Deltaproteobacteria bacterium]
MERKLAAARHFAQRCLLRSGACRRLLLPLCILCCGLTAGFLTETAQAGQASPVVALELAASGSGFGQGNGSGRGNGSGQDDEPGQIYFGTDERGNSVFGTDDKAPAGFQRDPESGDRLFRTAPPPKEDDGSGGGTQNIWVTPEVKPGHKPDRPDRPGVWPPRPNRR